MEKDKDEIQEIYGYKAFHKGLINRWQKKFEVGKKYNVNSEYNNYGYHFCDNLEDVFVFYIDDDIDICEVIGRGHIIRNYNSYYDVTILASSEIEIVKIMNRKEIINYFLSMSAYYPYRVVNFLTRANLTNEEVKMFINKFSNNRIIMDTISYYYQLDIDMYSRKYKKEN